MNSYGPFNQTREKKYLKKFELWNLICRTELFLNSFLPFAISKWNKLDPGDRKVETYSSFRKNKFFFFFNASWWLLLCYSTPYFPQFENFSYLILAYKMADWPLRRMQNVDKIEYDRTSNKTDGAKNILNCNIRRFKLGILIIY